MANVSESFVSALVLAAREKNAANPCKWLQDLQVEIVTDAVDPDDGRMRSSSLNGKSVTFWLELSSIEKIDALQAACAQITTEDADADAVADGFTNGKTRHADFRYASFS